VEAWNRAVHSVRVPPSLVPSCSDIYTNSTVYGTQLGLWVSFFGHQLRGGNLRSSSEAHRQSGLCCGLAEHRIGVRTPAHVRINLISTVRQMGSGGRLAAHWIDTEGYFHCSKAATYIPAYAFMAWWFNKHRNSLDLCRFRSYCCTWSHAVTHIHMRQDSSVRGIGPSQRPVPDNT